MPELAALTSNRDRLAEIAHRLIAGVATVRLSPGQLAAVRWQLCRQLLFHLSSEDRALHVNARFDRRVAGESSAFVGEQTLNDMLTAFMGHWAPETIDADPAGFCADMIRIVSTVLAHMGDERRGVPPMVTSRERRQS